MSPKSIQSDKVEKKRDFTLEVIDKISSICLGKSNVMISIFDTRTASFIYCSDAIEENLGYCPKELCSGGWKGWFEKIIPSQAADIKKSITYYIKNSALLRKQKAIHLTYHIVGLSGNSFQVRHEIMPYRFKEGLILLNFLYDTTPCELVSFLFANRKPAHLHTEPNEQVHITQRENEVMFLIGEGLSSKQIADQLFISIQTVLSHRKHLLEKFKAKNTAQLINKATVLQKSGAFYNMQNP